ncbi:MAG: hypothetical protein ABIA04_08965 [Pseudomonadota bacterium]
MKKTGLFIIFSILYLFANLYAQEGEITKISSSGKKVIIDVGSKDGVSQNDIVWIFSGGKKVGKGVVSKTKKSSAIVDITKKRGSLELGMIAEVEGSDDSFNEEEDEEEYTEKRPNKRSKRLGRPSGSNTGACLVSFILGAGAGEWLVLETQTFGSCCLEHLASGIPCVGQLVSIGSLIDAYRGEPNPQINWLFTTTDL